MIIVTMKGKDAFLLSLKRSSLMFTKPDNSLQVLFERDGDKFLCIVKKYGVKTNPEEAIALTFDEYKKSFGRCWKEQWFFNFFKDKKIITWR
jgi:hypothetical protein